MPESLEVVLICQGGLIRESIAEALELSNINVALKAESLRSLPDIRMMPGQVGVYVFTQGSKDFAAEEARLVPQCDLQNWVVLCEDRRNAIVESLLAADRPIATAPVDVSREDLTRLVELASRNRRLCVGGMCASCPAPAAQWLNRISLSDRQWTLLRYLSEGLSNKEIARFEDCTESNVKVRMRALLDKLEVTNRTKAAVMAAKAGVSYSRPAPSISMANEVVRTAQMADLEC